jgi:hypothetical protein
LLAHERRRVVHIGVTERPASAWTTPPVVDAFPEDTAPRWLLRDRDRIYNDGFRHRVTGLGITEVISSPETDPTAGGALPTDGKVR